MEKKPTFEQAQLHLKVYDLRREKELRKARDWFQLHYKAESFDDAVKLMAPGSKSQRMAGKVIGYWENACSLLNYGLLHEGLFFETSGEFYGVWEQLRKALPEFREKFGDKQMLSNIERAATRYEKWSEKRSPGSIEKMRNFMKEEEKD